MGEGFHDKTNGWVNRRWREIVTNADRSLPPNHKAPTIEMMTNPQVPPVQPQERAAFLQDRPIGSSALDRQAEIAAEIAWNWYHNDCGGVGFCDGTRNSRHRDGQR